MSWLQFIQTNIFATFLTLCVTVATCVISEVQGYKKMKLEHFDTIYHCLEDFTSKRTKIIASCNQAMQELSELLPGSDDGTPEKVFLTQYNQIYCRMNQIIADYSECLEFYLSISHFLYKYKDIRPIIKAECWSFLKIYEQLVEVGSEYHYKIQYAQIVDLVQFIKIAGLWSDKRALKKYLKKNHVYKF